MWRGVGRGLGCEAMYQSVYSGYLQEFMSVIMDRKIEGQEDPLYAFDNLHRIRVSSRYCLVDRVAVDPVTSHVDELELDDRGRGSLSIFY